MATLTAWGQEALEADPLEIDFRSEEEVTEIESTEFDGLLEIARDQSFIANLDYLLQGDYGKSSEKLREIQDNEGQHPSPRGFVVFLRGDTRFYIKKASLVWMLSTSSKRISTDRIYRFISEKKTPNGSNLQLGDFVITNFEKEPQLVQILAFRLRSGKKFYGDICLLQESDHIKSEAEMLLNFFKMHENLVKWEGRAQRWVSVQNYVKHVVLKRDIETGNLLYLV